MEKILLVFALAASVQAANAQLINASFENWQISPLGVNMLPGWRHEVKGGFENTSLFGTYQDSVSQHGQYALKLSRWYSYTWDQVRQQAPISFSPGALHGFYLYTDANLIGQKDTAEVEVYLTRWNAATQQPDTVGFGALPLSETPAFTPFTCAITYSSSLVPDSVTLVIKPTKTHDQCAGGGWCSFLTIDNLSLSALNAAPVFQEANAMPLWPNPAKRMVSLTLPPEVLGQTAILQLTDLNGKVILYKPIAAAQEANQQINLPALPAGLYMVHVHSGNQTWQQKLVVR